ncbi:MAG: hypothetical protein U5J62_08555 [Desulfurivibrio sp.]|nr:hypothetical protein [Desulfurivibrio sp.]
MIGRFLPWKYFLRLAARRFDFLDPISLMARARSFAQPSEVQEPIELLRAGMVLHARGLLNTKAIQHNLDWVWPYWVVRQFNPADSSFVPRGFAISHINLTHRNWTAVGLPDLPLYPVVDPRGLLTPIQDGWSLDCWFYDSRGRACFPSQLEQVEQRLEDDDNRRVVTQWESAGARVRVRAEVRESDGRPTVVWELTARSQSGGWLVVALRPYNPEGIQFVERVSTLEQRTGWLVNKKQRVRFAEPADKMLYANYRRGDVSHELEGEEGAAGIDCRIGMATAAAFFAVDAGEADKKLTVEVPLSLPSPRTAPESWPAAASQAAALQVPDARLAFLYRTAVRTLIHLSAADIVPGPYTYNRFWFRDACLMLHPLLAIGLRQRCRAQLDRFERRQHGNGFFHSQAGEWDANGQVLWLYERYRQLTGGDYNPQWLKPIAKAGRWLDKKRLSTGDDKYRGLLPAGFSAEHFGPNDYYYWDDFWAVAGLKGAAAMLRQGGQPRQAEAMQNTAGELTASIERSIAAVMAERKLAAMPASPNRRLDSAAIGSLVVDYPLQLWGAGDERSMAAADYLFANCLHEGGFFQDMIHSGVNIYMTLMLAQTYLRAGDPRFSPLLRRAVELASATGQWPEAIHPRTGGGCMGDGQHGWAAAELLMLIRNMFVLEEEGRLLLGKGLNEQWLPPATTAAFGPTLTPYGPVSVNFEHQGRELAVRLTGDWYGAPPEIMVEVPGWRKQPLTAPDYCRRLAAEDN